LQLCQLLNNQERLRYEHLGCMVRLEREQERLERVRQWALSPAKQATMLAWRHVLDSMLALEADSINALEASQRQRSGHSRRTGIET
jgi:hypothetical protein